MVLLAQNLFSVLSSKSNPCLATSCSMGGLVITLAATSDSGNGHYLAEQDHLGQTIVDSSLFDGRPFTVFLLLLPHCHFLQQSTATRGQLTSSVMWAEGENESCRGAPPSSYHTKKPLVLTQDSNKGGWGQDRRWDMSRTSQRQCAKRSTRIQEDNFAFSAWPSWIQVAIFSHHDLLERKSQCFKMTKTRLSLKYPGFAWM